MLGARWRSPALGFAGVTYTLAQYDPSNWYHPLGFSYYPDGAHYLRPELEDPVPFDCSLPLWRCHPNVTGQAPVYFVDGAPAADGLDYYEPAFQVDEATWAESQYSVQLTIPIGSKSTTLFYFCHVHVGMSGRINVVQAAGATGLNALVMPFDPVKYYESLYAPSTGTNLACGTRGVPDNWRDLCKGMSFMCKTKGDVFGDCMQAIDCLMHTTMSTVQSANPVATFMDQARGVQLWSSARVLVRLLRPPSRTAPADDPPPHQRGEHGQDPHEAGRQCGGLRRDDAAPDVQHREHAKPANPSHGGLER